MPRSRSGCYIIGVFVLVDEGKSVFHYIPKTIWGRAGRHILEWMEELLIANIARPGRREHGVLFDFMVVGSLN